MDKIIVIYGDSNVGKTTVINEIFDALVNNKKIPKQQAGANKNDFTAVLQLNGKHIAINSMGDIKYHVDSCIQQFASCDVFITAYNKKFVNIGSSWLDNANVIYKVPKTAPTNADNQFVRQKVISLI